MTVPSANPPVFAAPPKTVEVKAADPVVTEHVTKKAKGGAWEDLDADDSQDPLMVSEYVTEIFEYMRELEVPII